MKGVIARVLKMFGRYIFAGILLIVSVFVYYIIWRDGINSFYHSPIVGVISIIIIAFINALYFVYFIFSKDDKTTFGK